MKTNRLPSFLKPGLLLLLLTLALSALTVRAQTPQFMTYQGYLTDGNGSPLGSTNTGPKAYSVVFRIWNAPNSGTEYYGELQTVTVDNGYFSVLLGQGTSYAGEPRPALGSVFANNPAPTYIEMTVLGIGAGGANITLSPRLQLVSSPYAFAAGSANTAQSAASLLVPNAVANPNNVPAVTVLADGNVGIGTNSPNAPLQVAGAIDAGSLNLSSPSASPLLSLQNSLSDPSGIWGFYYGQTATNGLTLAYANGGFFNPALTVTTNGSVSIGSADPQQAALDVESGSFLGAVINGTNLYGTCLTLGNGYGLGSGLSSDWNEISLAGFSDSYDQLVFSWGGYPGSQQRDVLTLVSSGKVGIGTSSPSGGLDVEVADNVTGTASYFSQNNDSFSAGSYYLNTNPRYYTTPISIYTSYAIGANAYYAFSDARIKNITGVSSGAGDLNTLRSIQVTDFNYKDQIAKGSRPVKKVIAQQVEKVFPQAVSQGKGVIPDIYRQAAVKDNWVQLATDLKVGERVRLIGQDNSSAVYDVLAVSHAAFQVKLPTALDQVFVYGREVNDFRTVDYDAISMLNVSATQELANRLDKLEARASQVAALEQEVGDLKKLVAQLAEAAKTSKMTAKSAADQSQAVTTASLDR